MTLKYFINCLYLLALKIMYKNSVIIEQCPKTHFLPKIRVNNGGEIVIGKNFKCDRNTSIESFGGRIIIGDNVYINSNVKIVSMGKIIIGNNTIIAPNVCVYDHNHNYKCSDILTNFTIGTIDIGKGVWIGANCVILKDSIIGDSVVIGAGSIVNGTIPQESILIQRRDDSIIAIRKY